MGTFVNKTALIYNISPNKCGFAISDDDESIFIHKSAVLRDDLQADTWYELKCMLNTPSDAQKPNACKWQSIGLVRRVDPVVGVVKAEPEVTEAEPIPYVPLDERIKWLFSQPDHAYAQTGGEIAEKLSASEVEVNQTRARMRRDRVMQKASVECGKNVVAASHILWAPDAYWFSRS